jgi:hypothetical protein
MRYIYIWTNFLHFTFGNSVKLIIFILWLLTACGIAVSNIVKETLLSSKNQPGVHLEQIIITLKIFIRMICNIQIRDGNIWNGNSFNQNIHRLNEKTKLPRPESSTEVNRPSDLRLSAKLVTTFADRGCHVVGLTDPYGRILGLLDRTYIGYTHIYAEGEFQQIKYNNVH